MHEAALLSFAYAFGQVRESREIIEFVSATSLAGVQLEAVPA
jgi:hypothetical protein